MQAHGVGLDEVYRAVRESNMDVGARTIEINQVEYLVRGVGFVKSVGDLENAVVRMKDNVPLRVRDIGRVALGPALRTGLLDKEGVEAVGGVVVARFGENPLQVIHNVKKKIAEMSPGLPKKTLDDGTVSQVAVVPFYDRTGLIKETLGTLNDAIYLQMLITVVVILIMVNHPGSSILISVVLPVAVLMSFIGMKLAGIPANIVSLSGIAIAIGTIVDMGIILTENTIRHIDGAGPDEPVGEVVFRAASEVGGAILAAVSTTIVSFLPVFTMTGAEGKLFKPLAYTKTFALAASIIVALTIVPSLARLVFTRGGGGRRRAVVAGKPYLEITMDRDAIARYGLSIGMVQEVIEIALGGKGITTTVEGRERYSVRVRYPRELRGDPGAIGRILIPAMGGAQIPLGQLARVSYRRGPEMIKGEETFPVSYVLFDKKPGYAEVNVVEDASRHLKDRIDAGELVLPAGVSYVFAGSYENQVRSEKRLAVILPLAETAVIG